MTPGGRRSSGAQRDTPGRVLHAHREQIQTKKFTSPPKGEICFERLWMTNSDEAAELAVDHVRSCIQRFARRGGDPASLAAALLWHGVALMRGGMSPAELATVLYALADHEVGGRGGGPGPLANLPTAMGH